MIVKLDSAGSAELSKAGYTTGAADFILSDADYGADGGFYFSGEGKFKLGPQDEVTSGQFVAKINQDGTNAWFFTCSSACRVAHAASGVLVYQAGAVTKLAGDGQSAWSTGNLGVGGTVLNGGAGELPNGHVLLWGQITGTSQFGNVTLTASSKMGFIAELDSAGAFVSARTVPHSLLFADSSGSGVYFAAAVDGHHTTIGKLSVAGDPLWTRDLATVGTQPSDYLTVSHLVSDSHEGFALYGIAGGAMAWGCGTAPSGDYRVLAQFDGNGDTLWNDFPNIGPVEHLALDGEGRLLLGVPVVAGAVNIGGTSISGDGRVLIAKYKR